MLEMITEPSRLLVAYLNETLTNVYRADQAHEPETSVTMFDYSAPAMSGNDLDVSVSMHVRQGDSCDVTFDSPIDHMETYLQGAPELENRLKKRPCFSIDVYMGKLELLRQRYRVNKVFLATDSEDMIARAHQHPEYHWVYINMSRAIFSKENGWIDFRKEPDRKNILFSAIADLLLMRSGDIFLGSFAGHFSKIAYYIMSGAQMRLPPFISLDYPLSCDTVEGCSDSQVLARNQTVEDIIVRAPEC